MVLRGNADPEMFDLISRNLDEINKIIGSAGIKNDNLELERMWFNE